MKNRILVIGVMALTFMCITGCDNKPYYSIDGSYTLTYVEKKGCVIFSSSVTEQKICGDYRIVPRNGAKLIRTEDDNGL